MKDIELPRGSRSDATTLRRRTTATTPLGPLPVDRSTDRRVVTPKRARLVFRPATVVAACVSRLIACAGLAILLFASGAAQAATPQDALSVLERAATFFRDRLGVEGTYVWRYSADGTVRMGEGGKVPSSIGWVEPPGTPAIGAAFLRLHQITGQPEWLEAARTVAEALVRTQLVSGGWFYKIETSPELVGQWCYRSLDAAKKCPDAEDNPNRNRTVLDDNTTQSVLNFLMWFDEASAHSVPVVDEAIKKGLKRLMKAQYANGAFPVFFTDKIPGQDVPSAAEATMPDSWSQTWIKPVTAPYFVTNDNLPRNVGRSFLNAYRLYGKDQYLATARRVGDFLLAAQLLAPQRGWSQQYDRTMQPVWGREFEPPSVVSHETAGCIEYLIELSGETGERKYLDAARSAADWLEAVRLPDGNWARFYELKTDRPLYVDNENRLTFSDDDLLGHYGMKGQFEIPKVLARLRSIEKGAPIVPAKLWVSEADELDPSELSAQAQAFVDGIDAQGRWADDGWIDGRRFMQGVFVLARFFEDNGDGP